MLCVRAAPVKRDEGIVSPIAAPGLRRFEQPPVSVTKDGVSQNFQQPLIEAGRASIDTLDRPAAEVRGQPQATALELTLMEEPQAWREKSQHRGRFVDLLSECRSGTRFVMVLQEPCEPVLEVETRSKVIAHRAGVPIA